MTDKKQNEKTCETEVSKTIKEAADSASEVIKETSEAIKISAEALSKDAEKAIKEGSIALREQAEKINKRRIGMIESFVKKSRIKSPWLIHFDCGSCNGCDIETLACLTPIYDVERFGIINVGNPKHADILLVTGTVNHRNKKALRNIYDQMPNPKVVIAIGACGLSGGIFREAYNVVGGVDKVIPVDVYVPGCPAKPEAIIDGVVKGLERFSEKVMNEGWDKEKPAIEEVTKDSPRFTRKCMG